MYALCFGGGLALSSKAIRIPFRKLSRTKVVNPLYTTCAETQETYGELSPNTELLIGFNMLVYVIFQIQ